MEKKFNNGYYRLGDLFKISSGSTPDTKNLGLWDGNILWYTPIDLKNNTHTQRKIKLFNDIVPAGTILISSRAPIGYIGVAKEKSWHSQGIKGFINDEKVVFNKYFKYWLSKSVQTFISLGTGSTFAEISVATIKMIDAFFPNKKVQQQIIDIIEPIEKLLICTQNISNKIMDLLHLVYKHTHDLTYKKTLFNKANVKIIRSGIDKFIGFKEYLDTSCIDHNWQIKNGTKISWEMRPSRANMQPINNSVWIAKLKNSPKFIIVKKYMNHIINTKILSTGFLGMETPFPNYLYALVSSEEFQYEKNINSSGTTMQSINNNILYNMLIQNCDESTLVWFESVSNCWIKVQYICNIINFRLEKQKQILIKLLIK